MKTKSSCLCTLLAILTLTGCTTIQTTEPIVLHLHPSVTAATVGMKISDERKNTVGPNLKADYTEVIDWIHVLPGRRKVADLVASVVATRFPDATVVLHEFELSTEVNIWTKIARCVIVVDVTPVGKRTISIRAEGTNKNQMGGTRNSEIAAERALFDLAEKLASVTPPAAQ